MSIDTNFPIYHIHNTYFIRSACLTPAPHEHFASHLIFGLQQPFLAEVDGCRMPAEGIAIGSGISHTIYTKGPVLVAFLDALTPLDSCLKKCILRGRSYHHFPSGISQAVSQAWLTASSPSNGKEAILKLEQLTGLNPDFPVTEDSRILEAADYIHRARNLESLTVQEIARAVCLSESRLSHLFKQEAGISLHLYLANMKLERAFYLIPTGKPLTDICMESGFSSPSHMSDISRKLYGLSMTQVKKLFFGGHAPVELS